MLPVRARLSGSPKVSESATTGGRRCFGDRCPAVSLQVRVTRAAFRSWLWRRLRSGASRATWRRPRGGTRSLTQTARCAWWTSPSRQSTGRNRGWGMVRRRFAAQITRRSSATALGPRTAVQYVRTYGWEGSKPAPGHSFQSRGAIRYRFWAGTRPAAPGDGAMSVATGGRSSRRTVPGAANRMSITIPCIAVSNKIKY